MDNDYSQDSSIEQSAEHAGGPQLFALLIGIDRYARLPFEPLRGAVGDAEAMGRYLTETLKVSENNIRKLYDKQATREAVIQAFKDLRDDPRIDKGDPIVIFYSGHGGRLTAPTAWRGKAKIECLIPQNCQLQVTGTEAVQGREPIPDRTIGALIEDIAEAKGNNITVIFDCCHAGSGTRAPDEQITYNPRSVTLLNVNIREDLDRNLWGKRVEIDASDLKSDVLPRSHVLLAACEEEELAWENPRTRQGQFTTALLKVLKHCTENNELACITYARLLDHIHLKKYHRLYPQHPRCEGFNQYRLLFNGRLSSDRVFYPVICEGRKYVVGAGLAHGISHGLKFSLYDDKQKRLLGVVRVGEDSLIEDFQTTVITTSHLTGVSFATPSGIGKLPLYVDPGSLPSFRETLRLEDLYGTDMDTFQLVKPEEAKLEVRMENNSVVLKVLDSERYERGKKFGLTKLTHEIPPDRVAHVLRSATHYYWFLDFAKERDQTSTKHDLDVTIDFYLLNVDYSEYGDPLITLIKPGLCHKDPNWGNSDVIDFVVDPEAFYGLEITNKTRWDLYLNVFLFNNSSLSIVRYYTQPTDDKHEAPLKRGGTFTIGYDTDTSPFSYSLQEGQDIDVGYLKIFFTTQPIDLSEIEQQSPFPNARDAGGIGSDVTKSSALIGVVKAWLKWLPVIRESDVWFTLDIPVVQRRSAAK